MSKTLEETMADIIDQIKETHPEVFEVMDQVKRGELSEEKAMVKMLDLTRAQHNSDSIVGLIGEGLAPFRTVEDPEPKGSKLAFNRGHGLPRMNPLMEAAIMERLQFDGDAPELRSGPMTPGVKPAVPVDTNARNGAMIGLLLRAASDQMAEKIQGHEQQRMLEVGAVDEEGALMVPPEKVETLVWGKQETDHPEYRRGEEPAPMAVLRPSGAELAAMSPQERQEATWKFLSTTQGRRSALATLRTIIKKNLVNAGFDIEDREPPNEEVEILSFHEWKMSMGGEGNTQPGMAVVDNAAASLYRGLVRNLKDTGKAMWLEVTAVNTVDVRQIGWAARLVSR